LAAAVLTAYEAGPFLDLPDVAFINSRMAQRHDSFPLALFDIEKFVICFAISDLFVCSFFGANQRLCLQAS
jgi:hypothetical protein